MSTYATGDVAFCGHAVANLEAADFAADFHDFAREFVTDRHWHRDRFARPVVPLKNVNVGAANRRALDAYQYIVVADFGLVELL